MKTIASEWLDFERMVFEGVSVSETQRTEMRRAFYAGFLSLLGILLTEIGEDHISEAAGVMHLELLSQEGKRWHDDLKRGRV